MHRTISMPRCLGWSLLLGLAGFALHVSALTARAQGTDQLPPIYALQPAAFGQQPAGKAEAKDGKDGKEEIPIVVIPSGATREVEMKTKEIIAEVRSENPAVCRVQIITTNPKAVLITALKPGSSRVTLTDAKKRSEAFEVVVEDDAEAQKRKDLEKRRQGFLDLVRKALPLANVDAVAKVDQPAVITGTVPNPETVQAVLDLANRFFPGNIVNALRVGGVQQVELEVVVARVSRNEIRTLSFNWLAVGNRYFIGNSLIGSLATAGGVVTGIPAFSGLSGPTTTNAAFGIVSDKQGFLGFLQALRTEGLVKLMAEPKLTTLSGRHAYFISGGEQAVPQVAGLGGTAGVDFKNFGTEVGFLPIVLGNGKIYLEVEPSVTQLDAAAGVNIPGGGFVAGRSKQSVRTAVTMEDGQTLAIGGLIQNVINAQVDKVPLLGDLPFLGALFSAKKFTQTEEEMLILVTARLVDPMGCTQLPHYLPGRETRIADDFELFLEGILEAPRGQRQPCYDRHYHAAHTVSTNGAALYPCGDASGHGGRCWTGCGTACGTTGCGTAGCGTGGPTTGNRGNGYSVPYPTMRVNGAATSAILQITPPAPFPVGNEETVETVVEQTITPITPPPANQETVPVSSPQNDEQPSPPVPPPATFGPVIPAEPR